MAQSFPVASSNFFAECLVIEITETSSTVDPIRFFQILNRIAGMGLGISTDDDGTNSSSTAYAKTPPATEFKSDTSLVADMLLESDSDMTIVKATIKFGLHLDRTVGAEGFEDLAAFNKWLITDRAGRRFKGLPSTKSP